MVYIFVSTFSKMKRKSVDYNAQHDQYAYAQVKKTKYSHSILGKHQTIHKTTSFQSAKKVRAQEGDSRQD